MLAVKLATSSDSSLVQIPPQAMRHRRLLVLVINPTGLRLLNKQASRPQLRLNWLRIQLMHEFCQVLHDQAQRSDVRRDFLVIIHPAFSSVPLPGADIESLAGGTVAPVRLEGVQ